MTTTEAEVEHDSNAGGAVTGRPRRVLRLQGVVLLAAAVAAGSCGPRNEVAAQPVDEGGELCHDPVG
jgi:hypothetical protein